MNAEPRAARRLPLISLLLAAATLLLVGCGDTTSSTTGAACAADAECAPSAWCSAGGVCTDRGAEGDGCTRDAACAAALSCLGGVCTPATTTPCVHRLDCPAPLICRGDGTCVDGAALGEPCDADPSCAQPLICVDGACEQPPANDTDNDGHLASDAGGDDCDDTDPSIYPGSTEICGDGVDQDCSGLDLACDGADDDNDGHVSMADGGPDCDDTNPDISPDGTEICGDGIDQDCSGQDLACPLIDDDGDGHAPLSEGGDDCDDTNPEIHGQAFDYCDDGIDQDCDSSDNVCVDGDGDGYPDLAAGGDDCDDTDADISPGAEERCGDGIDQDCANGDNTCPTEACEFQPTVGQFTPSLKWEFYGSSRGQDTGEKVNCTATPIVVPLSDDNGNGVVDEDDIPVVVFHGWNTNQRIDSVLWALRGDTGAVLWNTENTGIQTDGSSSPAGGDLDNDGWPEIVVRHEDGHVVAFDDDGSFLWESPAMSSDGASSPAIHDLDHDGAPEVIFGKHVISATGQLLASGSAAFDARNGRGSLSCVANLDGTGNDEIIAGPYAYAYDVDGGGNATMSAFWPADAQRDALGDGYCAVADVDLDGDPDVIHISLGHLAVLDGPTGAILTTVDVAAVTTSDDTESSEQGRCGAPTIGDFDNDGAPEIGMACKWSYAVFDAEVDGNGTLTLPLLWERTVEDDSSNRTGSSVFDFEADGRAEVVYNDEEYLRVYDGETGDVLFEEPNSSRTQAENPVIVDADNDGNAEIVVCASNDGAFPHDPGIPNNHGVTLWGDANDNWVPTRRIWNQHTYSITNVDDDGGIPASPVANHTVFNNYRANAQGDGVLNAPDLRVEIVDVRTNLCPTSLRFGVRVVNDGQLRVGPGIPVSLVVTDGSGATVWTDVVMTTKGLPPGASQRLEVTVPGPFGGGVANIEATVDDDGTGKGTANECREGNNTDAELDIRCQAFN